jgi:folylpolyglutamate synthase/dihydropteroate synthase
MPESFSARRRHFSLSRGTPFHLATQLAEIAAHHAANFEIIPDADQAVAATRAQAAPDDIICITGSLYLVGQLRHYWVRKPSQ